MSSLFNAKNRNDVISKASSENYDLIIIGGGVTGAGILLDAASRGLKTILVEKSDFAAGTSSRSTKLIHGGLRYLKNLEFRLVHNIGKERNIAYKNAPHLVIPEKLLLPVTKNGSYKKWQLRWALKLYDLLAGVKSSDKRQILNKKNTLLKEPILNSKNLLGAGYYAEYRTDDARLTLEIIKTSFQYNGRAINYCQAIDVGKNNNKITSITCKDILNDVSFRINSKKVVNACGPWVDDFNKLDHLDIKNNISLSKGIHIVLNKEKLPLNQPVYFDVNDGRMCFAIPRSNSTYIGTTDTEYFGEKEEPKITNKDVSYLLNAVNEAFQVPEIVKKDIVSSWAGLRPLVFEKGKKNAELSRKDEILISASGLITIAGGKLTGYRIMGKKVVDLVCDELKIKKACKTSEIIINGGNFQKEKNISTFKIKIELKLNEIGIDKLKASYLIRNYGTQTNEILRLLIKNNFNHLIEAEVVFCLNNESVYNPLDFFLRRTGKIYFNPECVLDELEIVMPYFTSYLNLGQQMVNKMKDDVKKYLKNATTFKS